jgi:copper(I)-binding protein
MRLVLLILIMLCSAPAMAQVEVAGAWARATPPGAKTAAIYLDLHNSGANDALVAAVTDTAQETQLHTHRHEGGMMRMEQVERFELPAGEVISLKPGGKHLMLIGLLRPLQPGETVNLTLLFENRDRLLLQVPVRDGRTL